MSELLQKIKKLASEYLPEVISIRRHIHANPELSFQEFNTSKYIAAELKRANISFTDGIVKTGIVAIIKGKNPDKKTIALRGDMDALPIKEENNVDYKSQNDGVMHACGHDAHTACVLGAAKILNDLRNEFEGTVKIIFQPGEEKHPGGASLMIKEGVLENPKPTCIIGQHVFPSMEAGKVGFRSGMYMASTDEIYITVKGKGGHAAMPHTYINPLLIASEIILALEAEFMSKRGDKTYSVSEKGVPTVLAFGKIIGAGATNVIPNEVKLEGTFRTMDEVWRKEAHEKIKAIVSTIVKKHNASSEVNISVGYPFLVNDDKTTSLSKNAAKEYLGKENVEELDLRMTAEDFAYYTQLVPACFYRLGTGNKAKDITANVHTNTFDIDERALEIGSGLMAWIAMRQLEE